MAGRPAKHARNASRTLDLDIIIFGNRVIDLPHLTIPHPELQNRFFVLDPLVEIAPEWQCPQTNLTLQELRDKLLQRAK
jgi:2-amino-4-hydroxy-6-hydroxymethyldihydropteridine diphosphokinase